MLTIKILEIILRNTLINFNRLKQIPACNITLASVFLKKKPNTKMQTVIANDETHT
jgi:hypothetical protein